MKIFLKVVCALILCVTSVSQAVNFKDQRVIIDPSVLKKYPELKEKLPTTCGQRTNPLRVAGMVGNAPFGWVEADSETQQKMESFGLGRVVLDKVVSNLGISYVSIGFKTTEEAVQALKLGKVDLLMSSYNNLGQNVKISYPSYFKNVFVAYFKKGHELPIESYQDLVGLKGVVREEEMIYPLIYQQLPANMKLQRVWSAATAFEMLMHGDVDYILASPYALEGELRRHKLQDDIISDGTVLGEATIFFAFSLNSPCIKLEPYFSKIVEKEGFSQRTLDKDVRKLIDAWGNRFREDKVLIETENNTNPEDRTDQATENKE